MPKISVLIPVHNREELILPCIESARAQTFRDIEIIVSDNASTDGTLKVCEELAKKDKRISVLRNGTNQGPVLNWRRCMEAARGEFGKILFSDDLMAPKFLEKTVPFLSDERVGFVFSEVAIGSGRRRNRIDYRWKRRTGVFPSTEFIGAALRGSTVPVSPGAGLFRMTDLRKNLIVKTPDGKHGDVFCAYGAGPDMLIYMLTARQYPLVGFIADPLVFFRVHGDSITMKRSVEVIDGYTRAAVWFLENGLNDKMKLSEVVARAWLTTLYARRRYTSWSSFVRRYTAYSLRFPIFYAVVVSYRLLVRRLSRLVQFRKDWVQARN